MSKITIRPCKNEECPAVLELWKTSESIPSLTDTPEALDLVLQHNDELLLVAESEGRIVGTVMGGWDGWRGNIYRLAVLPEYRRRGIGSALVDEVAWRLRRKGARKISIMVERTDDLANEFWKAMKKSDYEYDPRIIRYTRKL
jgi:ribosomal protein S18 acetylase RimI-like enzyme